MQKENSSTCKSLKRPLQFIVVLLDIFLALEPTDRYIQQKK